MLTLFEKLLQLPAALTTAEQRTAWQQFSDQRMPALPLSADGTRIVPARILNDGGTGEGPELYAMYPHRVFTKGRNVATGRSLDIAVTTLTSSGFVNQNEGWPYGLVAAALAGETAVAAPLLLARATSRPAPGYRWPQFASHFQDFDPSADHFALLNRCLNDMLIQSGEDGFDNTTIVMLPAWPCGWDVQAKLWAPLNTSVELDFRGGALAELIITPPSRAGAVKFANCVSAEELRPHVRRHEAA